MTRSIRRQPRRSVDDLVTAVAFPALIAAMLTLIAYVGWTIVVNHSRPVTAVPDIALKAPPCAATTAVALKEIKLQATRRFAFRGVRYGLHRGQAECTASRKGGYLGKTEQVFCEFSNPGGLELEMAGRAYAFAPGPTNPATIWFEDGAPRCSTDSRLNTARRLQDLRRASGQAG